MNLEYNIDEKTQVILLNVSKMLKDRNMIKDYKHFYNNIKNVGENLEIIINYENNNIAIKIIYNNITTIKDSNDIETFLDKYNKYHKFLIISSIYFSVLLSESFSFLCMLLFL
jgi:multimeric flavodoxin WrbA